MDFLQDQLATLLNNGSVSPSTAQTIYSYTSTAYTYAVTLYTYATTYVGALLPYLPTTVPTTSAELVPLAILVLVLFTTFKVLDYARRIIMWWVFMAFKLGFLLLMVLAALYVHTYGLEKSLRDAGWLWGILEGLFENTMQNGQQEWNNVRGNTGRAQSGYRQGSRKVHANRPTRGRWS
jgi:Nuclear pore assembly and biogenesis